MIHRLAEKTGGLADWRHALPYLTALAIGIAGGVLFFAMSFPLPWLLGPLLATFVGALAGVPLKAPETARPAVSMVIGVMLGASFTPSLLSEIDQWLISLGLLLIYVSLITAVLIPYYMFFGRIDRVTAVFSAIPGGMAEMVLMGRTADGDERRIILAHASRIALTVGMIALYFQYLAGAAPAPAASPTAIRADYFGMEMALLAACGVIGIYVGRRLSMPAADLLGPALISMAAHLAGFVTASLPPGMVLAAQMVLGMLMGCRFVGCPIRLVLTAISLSIGATFLMLGAALLSANVFSTAIGKSPEVILLAFAPGGVAEIGIIALSLQYDIAFVIGHHLFRIVAILVFVTAFVSRITRHR